MAPTLNLNYRKSAKSGGKSGDCPQINESIGRTPERRALPNAGRGLKDDNFKDLILEFIDKYKQASKEEIDNLLIDILPGILNEKQRKNKIHNLIFAMSKKT